MKRRSSILRLPILALLTTLLVALHPGSASACSCAPVTTAEMVEASNVVFVGEEIARTQVDRGQDDVIQWASSAVTFQVAEAYKGNVSEQMTVFTGSGGGDCGVGPQSGLVGITASDDGGQISISICGSVHQPWAIAELLEPIELAEAAPAVPPIDEGRGVAPVLLLGIIGAVGLTAALAIARRRRHDWQDGWSNDI